MRTFLRKKQWLLTILVLGLGISAFLLTSCKDDKTLLLYDTSPIAETFKGMKGKPLFDILGPSVVDGGINFAVFSEHATRIEVLLFDDPESSLPTMRFPLVKDPESNIWTLFVYGIGVGQYYGYIAWGPNWPYESGFRPNSTIGFKTDCDGDGNRFNPNKLLIDPYALRIHRDFDWSKGNPASGTARGISTWGAASKSVVIKSDYKWSDNETKWRADRQNAESVVGHRHRDLIVYEVHPKGFTKSALDIASTGTYRGVGEMAHHLKDLGVTAVELLPVAEKPDDGTYWGYNNINFFAPEQRYAQANKREMNANLDEFKAMVDELHKAGIQVILDVVYNHTGEGGFWRSRVQSSDFNYGEYSNFDDLTAATIYSFRGLDNQSYYMLKDDDRCQYLDQTGVGNQTRTNHTPFRRLILDNLRYWVEEMHVDGFRFDLATVLGIPEDDLYGRDGWINRIGESVIQDIVDDPIMKKYNVRIIAEPWDLNHYMPGKFPKASDYETSGYAWSEWNGGYRDVIRQFVNKDEANLQTTKEAYGDSINVASALSGSSELYKNSGRKPFHGVNFVTAHDGFTLYDLVTYWTKENNCGKLNPVCCDGPYNAFCDLTSGDNNNESRNWCQDGDDPGFSKGGNGVCYNPVSEAVKRQMIRNFFAFMLLSHGTPMILGGDEFMRTQFGNNNAYSDSADNEYNWLRWGDYKSNPNAMRMKDFVKNTIAIRKRFPNAFSPAEFVDLQWRGPNGEPDWNSSIIARYSPKSDSEGGVITLINMDAGQDVTFNLPEANWDVLLDTQYYFDHSEFLADKSDKNRSYNTNLIDPVSITDGKYTLKSRSIAVLSLK